MAIAAGTRLGSYEIVSALGAGGMGEVYRARDTKLNRDVAIKVLPDLVAHDPERLARFEREAQVLAALNHPNIAHIHGLEESNGDRAIVMELVEGMTLAKRLTAPLRLEDALQVARQIADALEAAHDRGITHRDLKPANVMITPAGVVKVLDFGLAAVAQGSGSDLDATNSPTLSVAASRAGVILGTAGYMSPEQAAGKPVDKRADIWSFGVVLWEMLTGQRLFSGETISHTLADVLRAEIDFSKLPKSTPTAIRHLLRRCLDRDAKTRLRDIGEARIAIAGTGKEPEAPVTRAQRPSVLPWAAAALLAVVAISLSVVSYRHVTEEQPHLLKSSMPPPEKTTFANAIPAVSPDGRRLAFVAATADGKTALWIRELDGLAARPLPSTDGAAYPFWSPDSRTIAFFAGGKLKKTDVAGGPALTLCDAFNGRGGSWSKDNVIVFSPADTSGLFRVPAAGGNPTPVTSLDRESGENSHRFPWFLPDGRHFLYLDRFEALGTADRVTPGIYVGDLDSSTRRRIVGASSNAMYAPPGYLLFLREQTLMAQPFDAARAQTTSDAVPIAEQIEYFPADGRGVFSASQHSGPGSVLVYATAGVATRSQLTWFDRTGTQIGVLGEPANYNAVNLSPDGTRAAVSITDATGNMDIWLVDVARAVRTRFTLAPGGEAIAVWSPDGTRLVFDRTRGATRDLYQKAANESGVEEIIDSVTASAAIKLATGLSSDGKFLMYGSGASTPQTRSDIWILPLSGDRKPFPFLQTPFNERRTQFAPDSRWIAYGSNESGREEVYVASFPGPGGKAIVSTAGGGTPRWRRDGKEIFYVAPDGTLMAAAVNGQGPAFQVGAVRPLFNPRMRDQGLGAPYDVSADGRRFLINTLPSDESKDTAPPITLVVNWTAGLRK